jgi:hypothetical protein
VKVAYAPEVEDSATALLAISNAVKITGESGELLDTLVAPVQPVVSVAACPFVIADISPVPEPEDPEEGTVSTDGVNAEFDIFKSLY